MKWVWCILWVREVGVWKNSLLRFIWLMKFWGWVNENFEIDSNLCAIMSFL